MKTNLTYEELESFFKWVVANDYIAIKQNPERKDVFGTNYEFYRAYAPNIYVPDKIAEIYIKGTDNLRGINKV